MTRMLAPTARTLLAASIALLLLGPAPDLAAQGMPTVVIRDASLHQLSDSSVIIRFRTDDSVTGTPFVDVGTTAGVFPTTVTGTTMMPPSAATTRDHTVVVDGLPPATTHFYRFGTSDLGVLGGDTPAHRFTTAAPVGSTAPFSAWLVGDSGTGEAPQRAVRDAMLVHRHGTPPDLFLHAGDIAYDTGTDVEFTERFFGVYSAVLSRSGVWPTIGNHDADSANSTFQAGPYFEAFTLPTQGELGGAASGTEAYYSFDHHNVHFIVIDSAEGDLIPPSTMLDWVVADLQGTLADWVVALFHHPPYSKGSHDSDDGTDSGGRLVLVREFLLPLLEAGGVDLVLSGHSHAYERSLLIDGAHGYGGVPNYATPDLPTLIADGHVLDGGDGDPYGDGAYEKLPGVGSGGEVCVVAGHGGRPIGGTGGHPVMAAEDFAFGSCILNVDGDLLWLENIRADGTVTDRVALSKGDRVHRVVATVEGAGRVERSVARPLFATGETVTLTAVPRPGWTFVEWTGDAIATTPGIDLTMTTDRNVTAHFAPIDGIAFVAANDLAWVAGQPTDRITTITAPNGGSGLPSTGALVDRATGLPTGVTLTVAGGSYDGDAQAIGESGSPLPGTDAWGLLHEVVNAHGSIGPLDLPSPAGDLVLTLTGLDPTLRHTIVLHGHRNDGSWDEASRVTLEGADAFRNESSLATTNPDPLSGGALFSGPADPSTRLPADNAAGWVARFTEVEAGSDGTVALRVTADGEIAGSNLGKHANALLVIGEFPPPSFVRGDIDGSGDLDLGDAIGILLGLFAGAPVACFDAADIDGDHAVDLADAISLLGYLFSGGPPPSAPFPACGPAETDFGCDDPGAC